MNENHYGFRSERSLSMARLEAVEGITDTLHNKKCAIAIFVDLKKSL